MSDNSSNDFWGWLIIIAIGVVGVMWLFDAGPFEKPTYTPSYNYPTSGGYDPSFTGSGDNNRNGYKCVEQGIDPQFRCKCKYQWMDINGGPICPYCHHKTVNHHN